MTAFIVNICCLQIMNGQEASVLRAFCSLSDGAAGLCVLNIFFYFKREISGVFVLNMFLRSRTSSGGGRWSISRIVRASQV